MKTFYLFVGLCLALCPFLNGQDCPDVPVLLETQADVDAFAADYPDCTELHTLLLKDGPFNDLSILTNIQSIQYALVIQGVEGLTTLTPFQGLQTVVHEVKIQFNPDLLDLTGLINLSSEGFSLSITDNPMLESISVLQGITRLGKVVISDNPALANLFGLSSLQSVNDLWLTEMPLITDLNSISNLDSFLIWGLHIHDMDGLSSLAELNPSYLHGPFEIYDCDELTSIGGFEDTYFDLGGLTIVNNDKLEDLEGFEGLTEPAMIQVMDNEVLSSFHGLENVEHLTSTLIVESNPSLIDFSGLTSLKTLGFQSIISGNENLKSLDGLESLESTGPIMFIKDNPSLTSIDALENVTFQDLLELTGNSMLSDCSILSVCEGLAQDANFTIYDNGPLCSDEYSVIVGCSNSYNIVTGQVYVDLDCDNTFGVGEYPLIDQTILRSPLDQLVSTTNELGVYAGFMDLESTWEIYTSDIFGYTISPTNHTVTTDNSTMLYDELDFSYCPDSNFINFTIDITASIPPRPGFSHYYEICFQNIGSINSSCTVNFDFSGQASGDYVTILDPDGGIVSGNTIEWMIADPGLFQETCFTVFVEMDASTPLGIFLEPAVQITLPAGVYDANPSNNWDRLLQEVVGSFDPNDKSFFPEDYNITHYNNGTPIEYLIRFQNTGTYPATFVEVLDTIEANLDLSTFRMISASHDYTVILPEDRVIKWRFDNINLPDSTSNEPESHGFIKFSLMPIEGLALNDEIANRCGIYFDFNEPVITNYATTTLSEPLGVFDRARNDLAFELFPNPASQRVTIQVLKDIANIELMLYDVNGALVLYQKGGLDNQRVELSLADLPAGVYFIKLLTAENTGIRKLIIK